MEMGIVNIDRLKSELKEFFDYLIDKQISKEVYQYVLKNKAEKLLSAKCNYEEDIEDYICFFKDVQYVKSIEKLYCEDEYYVYEVYVHVKKIEDEKHEAIIDVLEINADVGEKEEEVEEENDEDYDNQEEE